MQAVCLKEFTRKGKNEKETTGNKKCSEFNGVASNGGIRVGGPKQD